MMLSPRRLRLLGPRRANRARSVADPDRPSRGPGSGRLRRWQAVTVAVAAITLAGAGIAVMVNPHIARAGADGTHSPSSLRVHPKTEGVFRQVPNRGPSGRLGICVRTNGTVSTPTATGRCHGGQFIHIQPVVQPHAP